jgi:hypothetical protein
MSYMLHSVKVKRNAFSECVNRTSTSGTRSKLRRKRDRLIDLLDPEVVIFLPWFPYGGSRFYSIGLGKTICTVSSIGRASDS